MKVEREIWIDAPVQRVYDVVMDPDRLKDWVTIHHHLEDAPNGMALVGLDGRIIRANRAIAEMFGRTPETAVGLADPPLVAVAVEAIHQRVGRACARHD